ncbi:MAG: acetyl-CoA C-acyltransferase [Gemmatimonadetes bacterium]|nr:acetyl-CoA C-acyltransferase [Gemmatimonadota bacterium]MYA65436.1 acetyl-CoA C-acyltransferase [Gemmatimonadota bacterium]MYB99144.1 acetyl-CoA C-acyltransferase [Gemmatimonadota bacterium]MYH54078.1 acetyl-CoA C-acyltransferase [Gemmatimonadota bacterium]MYI45312.1 acetyl-CoA C-acyltransferase [Gemmatimonadota bacterium]
MRDAWIVDAVRTPIGRHGGALAPVRPDDLAAVTIGALLDRNPFPAEHLDDVIFGCTNQAGEDNRNVARMALLRAGVPVEVPGQTVNRLCGSGLQAVASAFHAIRAGEGDAFIAGGVESMSRAPFVMLKPERGYTRGVPEVADTVLGWRFTNPRLPDEWTIGLGQTAEVVAREFGVTREEQDNFAAKSQAKAAAAIEAGRFDDEIVPVTIPQRHGEPVVVARDEHPRPGTTAEALARLRPVFAQDGTVTAGNSSGINDGAAALLVVEEETARAHGLEPMAVIRGAAVAGVEPHRMGIGPVPATRRCLARLGTSPGDLDLIELNEAFAAQAIPCIRELDLDPARVNVNGGAIALGHPVGCSGARILATLVHEMARRDAGLGLATMCIGVGQGIAAVVERG